MTPVRIAVLITCFNRREKTISCLAKLFDSGGYNFDYLLDVYLVDDGSTDGTAAEVAKQFPHVNLISGHQNLYWCRGMKVAEKAATGRRPDFYMWLNDDTMLFPTAILELLSTYLAFETTQLSKPIVIGSTQDPSTGAHSYGGLTKASALRSFSYLRLAPSTEIQFCDAFNGNLVLIPAEILTRTKGLDPTYEHALGDIDFALRCARLGVPLIVAPGYHGVCSRNSTDGTYLDPSKSRLWRLKNFTSRKALPPNSWRYFVKRNAGVMWPFYFVFPYIKFFVSLIGEKMRK